MSKSHGPVTWAEYRHRRMAKIDGALTVTARCLHLFVYLAAAGFYVLS